MGLTASRGSCPAPSLSRGGRPAWGPSLPLGRLRDERCSYPASGLSAEGRGLLPCFLDRLFQSFLCQICFPGLDIVCRARRRARPRDPPTSSGMPRPPRAGCSSANSLLNNGVIRHIGSSYPPGTVLGVKYTLEDNTHGFSPHGAYSLPGKASSGDQMSDFTSRLRAVKKLNTRLQFFSFFFK